MSEPGARGAGSYSATGPSPPTAPATRTVPLPAAETVGRSRSGGVAIGIRHASLLNP